MLRRPSESEDTGRKRQHLDDLYLMKCRGGNKNEMNNHRQSISSLTSSHCYHYHTYFSIRFRLRHKSRQRPIGRVLTSVTTL